MIRLVLGLAVILSACGGGEAARRPTTSAIIPAVLNPSSGAAMAELWCPATGFQECKALVEAYAGGSRPAALCIFPDDTWSSWLPLKGDIAGSPCGPNGSGRVRGIIVAP